MDPKIFVGIKNKTNEIIFSNLASQSYAESLQERSLNPKTEILKDLKAVLYLEFIDCLCLCEDRMIED